MGKADECLIVCDEALEAAKSQPNNYQKLAKVFARKASAYVKLD